MNTMSRFDAGSVNFTRTPSLVWEELLTPGDGNLPDRQPGRRHQIL